MNQTIAIERVDHIGIRVRNLDRALNFYRVLGFNLLSRAEGNDVAIVRTENGVELNLVFNANAGDPSANVLMDAPAKYPGYTQMALRVASIPSAIAALKANDIAITQGQPKLCPRALARSRPSPVWARINSRAPNPTPNRHRQIVNCRATDRQSR